MEAGPAPVPEAQRRPLLVYFSSTSENTHRFVRKLGFPRVRIPLRPGEKPVKVDEEYILVVPTYGGGNVKGAVPKRHQVPQRS